MKKLNLLFVLLILTPLFSFQSATNNSIKVALLLDTSNSMDGLIDQAKSQLWNVVNELSVGLNVMGKHQNLKSLYMNMETTSYQCGKDI